MHLVGLRPFWDIIGYVVVVVRTLWDIIGYVVVVVCTLNTHKVMGYVYMKLMMLWFVCY